MNTLVKSAKSFRLAAVALANRSERTEAAAELRAITDRLGLFADEAIDLHIRAAALRDELQVVAKGK